jgi:hypothetical protein
LCIQLHQLRASGQAHRNLTLIRNPVNWWM